MIKTVDNFQGELEVNSKNKIIEINKNYYFEYTRQSDMKNNVNITLQDYIERCNSFFSFSKKYIEDELIFSLQKIGNKYKVQTGNFVGKFNFDGIDIEINSRFNEKFLKRMLNFADDIFLDDVDVSGEESKNIDISKFIIYYLFIQKLEKAFLLGLPKTYQTKKYHEIELKGKIDIKKFIKKDLPFKGKISSSKRELTEVQEIIDVLYKAIKIIKKDKFSTKNILNIVSYLKQKRSKNFVSSNIIKKALSSKALKNPIYAPYKDVLNYAKMIIENFNIDNKDSNIISKGFIVNVAELFEIYIRKLLSINFSDWDISSPEIKVFENTFFKRKLIPDIVMQKDNKILVFDVKYKKMNMRGKNQYDLGDVDRCDFFQINTYMSYYQNQGFELIAGGLLYPLEIEKYEKEKCFSDNWFGNNRVKFLISGIELEENKEEKFLNEIKKLLK